MSTACLGRLPHAVRGNRRTMPSQGGQGIHDSVMTMAVVTVIVGFYTIGGFLGMCSICWHQKRDVHGCESFLKEPGLQRDSVAQEK